MVDSQTTVRASHWSFTLNNPTDEDRLALRTAQRWLRKVKGQDEIGENGTLHVQGYANTDQVRMSTLKKWLPRAHFKSCITQEHIQRTLDYVHKEDDTTVANTQFEIVYRTNANTPLTMAETLTSLAEYCYSAEQIQELATGELRMRIKEIYEKEYWYAVSMILLDQPDLIQTFSMPCYKIAWINTRQVWIQKYRVDSQTKVNVLDSGEISPVSV